MTTNGPFSASAFPASSSASSSAASSSASSSIQLFFACTQYAAATVTAALRAGLFGSRADHRRILVVSDVSASPELGTPLDARPGCERLLPDFDEVRSWNDFIRPFHPAGWSPREQDAPLWQRAVREAWNLGDGPVEIACESIQANPSQAVATIFSESPIHIYADGLMSYGPTRSKLHPLIGSRVERLLHLDLVPGLEPLLLTEFGVAPEIIPTDVFVKVLAELADAADAAAAGTAGGSAGGTGGTGADGERPALLLGQYLSRLGILTPAEEEELHVEMVRGAVARGHRNVVFKPHPSAPDQWSRRLEEEAEQFGARLTVHAEPSLAEVLYQRLNPALVVACFSTALLTASAFYDLPVARVGTELLLERLSPYQNSNRVPVTIVDALLPPLDPEAATAHRPDERIAELVAAVGFAMQPQIYPELRPTAENYLTHHLDRRTWRYFKRRRLTALALPGAVPAQLAFIPRNATVRRVARRARSLKKATIG
ncbi:polysialyltransferase family glycosyltransferase [Streptomyces sp. NPDC001780]